MTTSTTTDEQAAIAQLREQLTEEYLADPRLQAEAIAAIHASRQVVFAGWCPGGEGEGA